MAKGKGEGVTIVIKKEEGGEGGHHGGAWKVAYADFVTAMMAFFLLMWLLNATTEEQRRGLADYFNPTNVMGQRASGSGQPFGGRTPNAEGQASSDASSHRLETGPRPVIFDLEEDDSDTPASPTEKREVSGLWFHSQRGPRVLPVNVSGPIIDWTVFAVVMFGFG